MGYKRHLVTLVGTGLIAGALAQPADVAEHEATAELMEDVKARGTAEQMYIDRGDPGSEEPDRFERDGGQVICRAWPLRDNGLFTKAGFDIRLEEGTVGCSADEVADIEKGKALFPDEKCGACPLRERCVGA